MTSAAIKTQGFKFQIGDNSSPIAYTEVKEVVSFQGFDGTAAEIDVTNLQSTAKEFLMGLQDFGSFKIDCNYLQADAGQLAMRTAKAAQTITNFKVTFSDTKTAIFAGFVMSNPVSGGVDAKVDGSFNIRISGNVTFS